MSEHARHADEASEALEPLGEEDRLWLEQRLVEYKDLLEYLHAN